MLGCAPVQGDDAVRESWLPQWFILSGWEREASAGSSAWSGWTRRQRDAYFVCRQLANHHYVLPDHHCGLDDFGLQGGIGGH